MMPQRIQLRRTKGWRKPEGAIIVARPSRWGNPYRVDAPEIVLGLAGASWWIPNGEAQAFAVRMFRLAVEDCIEHPQGVHATEIHGIANSLGQLRGHDLACWCPLDQPCHADVLLELANQRNQP